MLVLMGWPNPLPQLLSHTKRGPPTASPSNMTPSQEEHRVAGGSGSTFMPQGSDL